MTPGTVQNAVVGFAFVALGVALIVIPPRLMPSWLKLKAFARYRIVFALATIALGAVLVSPVFIDRPKPYTVKHAPR